MFVISNKNKLKNKNILSTDFLTHSPDCNCYKHDDPCQT